MKLSALTVLATLALTGCDSPLLRVPAPPLGAELTGDQIKTVLAGNTVTTVPERVPPLIVYFNGSGELRGLRSNQYRDKGEWRIKDDTLCGKWDNWQGTMTECWKVFRFENRLTLKSVVDAREFSGSVTAGNVGNL